MAHAVHFKQWPKLKPAASMQVALRIVAPFTKTSLYGLLRFTVVWRCGVLEEGRFSKAKQRHTTACVQTYATTVSIKYRGRQHTSSNSK